MLTVIVYFTSPDALKGFDNVNESGHIKSDTTLKHLNIVTVICVASGERLNHEAINPAAKNSGMFQM